jgi:ABC-type transport system involved in multi-copper enzyme maturation permease subunit
MTTDQRTPRLWRAELLKARTSPVTWGFAATIVLLTAMNTSLSLGDPLADLGTDAGISHAFKAGRDFAVLFIALGAVGAAGEFRHRTAVPTFLTTPARHRVLAAKAAAYGVVGALLALGCVAAQMAIALPWIAHEVGAVSPFDAAVLEPVSTTILSGFAYAAIGVGIGTLLRNQIVALVVTFGWFAVAENVLAEFAPGVSRYLPGGLFSGTDQNDLLAVPVAVAMLAVYALAVSVIAARTTLRQDI